MSAIIFPYYRFKAPNYIINEELYLICKARLQDENEIDFYGKPSLWHTFKSYIIALGVLVALSLLLWIKIYFLPTQGAEDVLEIIGTLLSFLIAYIIALFLSFTVYRGKINIYNKKVRKMIINSTSYQDFSKSYLSKFG